MEENKSPFFIIEIGCMVICDIQFIGAYNELERRTFVNVHFLLKNKSGDKRNNEVKNVDADFLQMMLLKKSV